MSDDLSTGLWLAGGAFVLYKAVGWIWRQVEDAEKYHKFKNEIERVSAIDKEIGGFRRKEAELKNSIEDYERKIADYRNAVATYQNNVERDKEVIIRLAAEKSKGFPWLASAYAQYFAIRDGKVAMRLEANRPPARRAAEQVRRHANEKKEAIREKEIFRHLLEYYESLFPWLKEFREIRDEDLNDFLSFTKDEEELVNGGNEFEYLVSRQLLTPEEYQKLSPAEKYQKALNNYWARRKNSWEIGRDYERYIGYLYENDGYEVDYYGIKTGVRDLGRDLIARNSRELLIIQCKRWSTDKLINENVVCQLMGTTLEYCYKNSELEQIIKPVLVTTTNLSMVAKEFAEMLGVTIRESEIMPTSYPCIKCNIALDTGERIYHLPFDQQYDNTQIGKIKGECYVDTVAQAELLGFRRAHRWGGEANN